MFTTMLEGTQEDWSHIAQEHAKHQKTTAATQIMDSLRRLEAIEVGFGANKLAHSLCALGRDGYELLHSARSLPPPRWNLAAVFF